NGTYLVTLTATDRNGGTGSDSRTIVVNNVAPTAVINGAPASGPEGTPISLTSTVTDPSSVDTAARLSYARRVTPNGVSYTLPVGTVTDASSFTFTPSDNGTFVVTLTATDRNGGAGSDSRTITVSNVLPAVAAGATQTANEGASTSFTLGSFTDPGAD